MKNLSLVILSVIVMLSYRSYGDGGTINFDQLDQLEYSRSQVDSIFIEYGDISKELSIEQRERLLLKLISESKRLGYSEHLGVLYNIIGVLYCNSSRYAKSLDAQRSSIRYSKDDEKQLIVDYNDIGVIYRRLDKPQLALQKHFEALKLIDNYSGDKTDREVDYEKGVSYNSIGNVNLTLNQPKEALRFFERSLELERVRGNKLGLAINLNNIGSVYQILNDYDKAVEYYRKSLNKNREIDSDKGLSICHNSIGDIFYIQEEYEKAKVQFDSAAIYSDRLSDVYHATQSHSCLSRVLLKLNDIDGALVHIKRFYEQAEYTNSGSLKYQSRLLFSEYYKQIGRFDSALIYYEEAVLYNDSIINNKNSNFLNDMQTLYLTKEKEQQIKLMTVDDKIKSQRITLLIFLAIILGMTVIVGVIYMSKRRKMNEYQNEQLKQQLLRSQMNPHFLFNALGSIQNYMYKNETKRAAGYLNNFALLTRSILEQSALEYISLEDEIETLHNYISLEQMRMDDRFDFSINYDNDVEIEMILVPPMFIQPFVENAIKHGLRALSYQGELNINITERESDIVIEVVDNGVGIDKVRDSKGDENSGHNSMATTIFNQRKKLLAKRINRDISMKTEDQSNLDSSTTGTVVTISLPIINQEES